jgi:probable DNA metabolism protein
MIYDKTHKAALIYENRRQRIIPLEDVEFPDASPEEIGYRELWKRFYNTVAIEERYNPHCRMTHMPKRYWENMIEVQEG